MRGRHVRRRRRRRGRHRGERPVAAARRAPTEIVHLAAALFCCLILPAYSKLRGEGGLSWTMFSRSDSFRLDLRATDRTGAVHLLHPLLGWPDPAAPTALGLDLPPRAIAALCVARTLGLVAFTLGAWTRAAGLVTVVAGYLVLYQAPFGYKLKGPLADFLLATPARCAITGPAVAFCELALGPLLLLRRTRPVGLALAVGLHLGIEPCAYS